MATDQPAHATRIPFRVQRTEWITLALLTAVAFAAWIDVIRQSVGMPMTGTPPTWAEGTRYVAAWGVMMAAMMLPSAAPMILLYHRMRSGRTNRAPTLPTSLFTLVYLLMWALIGVPVYLVSEALTHAAMTNAGVAQAQMYLPGALLLLAGLYQFTPTKHRCLTACRSPLSFLLGHLRNARLNPLTLGLKHAAYCVGCCWLLMVLLVFVGAMSLPWVLAISLIVLLEKLTPHPAVPYVLGAASLLLGLLLLGNPALFAGSGMTGM